MEDAIAEMARAFEGMTVRVPPPPVFCDRGNIRDFFEGFGKYCNAMYREDTASYVQVLPSFLSGEPRNIVLSFGSGADYETVGKWDTVEEVMGTPSTAVNFCQSPELVPTLREKAAVAYYTPVCIQGVREQALVDSGASVTMISENYACLMPNTWIKPLDGEFYSIEGVVQGSSLEMVGQLVVPIKLGKFISSNHRIVVVRGMKYSCILGMDFMERFFVSIDTTDRNLIIKPPGGVITRVDVTPVFASERPQKVSALQRVEIPPKTMVRVRAKVNIPVTGLEMGVLRL